jgi:hypothetical protein
MTRADLMRGDSPWRLRVRVDHPLTGAARAAWIVAAPVLVALAWMGLSTGLWACLAAGWAWVQNRPQVWLTGGGRRALSTTEWVEWLAHLDLSRKEQEHRDRQARRG